MFRLALISERVVAGWKLCIKMARLTGTISILVWTKWQLNLSGLKDYIGGIWDSWFLAKNVVMSWACVIFSAQFSWTSFWSNHPCSQAYDSKQCFSWSVLCGAGNFGAVAPYNGVSFTCTGRDYTFCTHQHGLKWCCILFLDFPVAWSNELGYSFFEVFVVGRVPFHGFSSEQDFMKSKVVFWNLHQLLENLKTSYFSWIPRNVHICSLWCSGKHRWPMGAALLFGGHSIPSFLNVAVVACVLSHQ